MWTHARVHRPSYLYCCFIFNSSRGKRGVMGHTGNPRRLSLEDCHEFDISLVYIENSRPAELHIETLKKKKIELQGGGVCV